MFVFETIDEGNLVSTQERGGTLSFDDTLQAIAVGIEARIPLILWGPPGQGKSSTIRQLAQQTNRHLETVIGSIREPSDFVGIPYVVDGKTTLIPPDWAVRLSESVSGLLFFDEISTAPPSTQAAMLRVVLERVAGDLYLGDNVSVVGAANPPQQASGGWDLSLPMANRFCHIDWELPADVVRDGLSVGWDSPVFAPEAPADTSDEVGKARLVVGSFLGARPDLVTKLPTSTRSGTHAFPTPRTWDMAAVALAYCNLLDSNPNVQRLLVNGLVGVGAGAELLSYIENVDLPDPDSLLQNPFTLEIPSRADRTYAIGASVINAISRQVDEKRWQNAGIIISSIANGGYADIAVVLARKWMQLRPNDTVKPDSESLRALSPILRTAGLVK